MINFYKFYNGNGLDNEHYGILIEQLMVPNKNYNYESIVHIIKKNPEYACWYARYVIKDRWEEAESYIMKDNYWSYMYAIDVIGFGRFHKAEPVIMEHPEYAYLYALNVIKGRWIEAEPTIMKVDYWWDSYCRRFNIC